MKKTIEEIKHPFYQATMSLINSCDVVMACLCQDDETGVWHVWDDQAMGEAMADLRQAVNNAKVVTRD